MTGGSAPAPICYPHGVTRFEFNSVLVSILLAFAAAELVTLWGRVLRDRARFGMSWPVALLSLWLFLSLVMHWFGLWAYRELPFDAAWQSLLVLLPAMVLALATHVLTPDAGAEGPGALEAHYRAVRRVAPPLCGLFMLLATVTDHALPGVLSDAPAAYFLASAASLAALAFTERMAVHAAVAGLNALGSAFVVAVARA